MNIRNALARAGAALALAFTGGCATTPAAPPEPPITPGPALWQVSDADTTIYLFGTVHVLPQETVWFDQRIERAFNASEELVFEIDLAAAQNSAQMVAGLALLQEGQTLRELMNEEDRAQYEAALQGFGLPVAALDKVEPWAAAVNLSLLPLMQAGYQPDAGVDNVLNARGGTKTLGALETIEEQIALFDTLPMEAQLEFLDATVEAIPRANNVFNLMIAEWLEGDADQLAELMNAELEEGELYDRLLIRRNAKWAEWIDQRLDAPGTVFIAVGAGHLAGRGSVQDMLATRGIEVTRVWR